MSSAQRSSQNAFSSRSARKSRSIPSSACSTRRRRHHLLRRSALRAARPSPPRDLHPHGRSLYRRHRLHSRFRGGHPRRRRGGRRHGSCYPQTGLRSDRRERGRKKSAASARDSTPSPPRVISPCYAHLARHVGTIGFAYVETLHAFVATPELATLSFSRTMLLMGASAVRCCSSPSLAGSPRLRSPPQLCTSSTAHPSRPPPACGALLLFVTFLSIIPAGLLCARLLEHVSLKQAAAEANAEQPALADAVPVNLSRGPYRPISAALPKPWAASQILPKPPFDRIATTSPAFSSAQSLPATIASASANTADSSPRARSANATFPPGCSRSLSAIASGSEDARQHAAVGQRQALHQLTLKHIAPQCVRSRLQHRPQATPRIRRSQRAKRLATAVG